MELIEHALGLCHDHHTHLDLTDTIAFISGDEKLTYYKNYVIYTIKKICGSISFIGR
jgi:hypothetical protein